MVSDPAAYTSPAPSTAKAAALCLQPFDDENLPDFIATADRVRTVMMRAAA